MSLPLSPDDMRKAIFGDDADEDLPDWVILSGEVRFLADRLRDDVAAAVVRFEAFDDVQAAIDFREQQVPRLRERVAEINRRIARLNLIAPHARFQRLPIDADEEVRPLARSYFRRRDASR